MSGGYKQRNTIFGLRENWNKITVKAYVNDHVTSSVRGVDIKPIDSEVPVFSCTGGKSMMREYVYNDFNGLKVFKKSGEADKTKWYEHDNILKKTDFKKKDFDPESFEDLKHVHWLGYSLRPEETPDTKLIGVSIAALTQITVPVKTMMGEMMVWDVVLVDKRPVVRVVPESHSLLTEMKNAPDTEVPANIKKCIPGSLERRVGKAITSAPAGEVIKIFLAR